MSWYLKNVEKFEIHRWMANGANGGRRGRRRTKKDEKGRPGTKRNRGDRTEVLELQRKHIRSLKIKKVFRQKIFWPVPWRFTFNYNYITFPCFAALFFIRSKARKGETKILNKALFAGIKSFRLCLLKCSALDTTNDLNFFLAPFLFPKLKKPNFLFGKKYFDIVEKKIVPMRAQAAIAKNNQSPQDSGSNN